MGLLILITPLTAFPAAGQQSAGHADPPIASERMQTSVARQAASASRMAASVERQRTAVQRQMQNASLSFFDMPGAAALPPTLMPPCDPLPSVQVDSLVQTASDSEGVQADLIRDVMKQESGFRPCAISEKGAMGLMQLMPATASDLAVNDPFDPQQNVTGGAKYLRQLMLQFGGDLALTLAAYNAGPARVANSMSVPQIPETLDYVQNILALFPDDKQPIPSGVENGKGPLIVDAPTDPEPLHDREE